jgi:CheY-like chemotaxis protein
VRILVADNSQADRQIYKRMLSQYQADIVGSGTSALDLFDTNNYDVILLDCNLEGIINTHKNLGTRRVSGAFDSKNAFCHIFV